MAIKQVAPAPPAGLRLTLTPIVAASLVVALLLAGASIVGLITPATVYPTADLRHAFLANDLVNLLVVLPFLLGAIALARRGRLVGLLCWPGALFVVFYNSIVYVVALPVNAAFLMNLLLLASSVYILIALVASVDAGAVRDLLEGHVPARLAGGVLMAWGTLFTLFVLGALAGALVDGTPVPAGDRGLHMADLTIAPALLIGGYLLWRRHPLGYVAGAGLLFQANLLFVGLLAVLFLQPLLVGTPLPVGDLLAVGAMWLVGLYPFARFLRGIGAGEHRP